MVVISAVVDPTQVHIQITISLYSYIDYSHEFVGSALARFERSTLPKHEGTMAVVLRFLKIITPVKCVVPFYDGYICCPKEGELYQKSRRKAREVWSVKIEKSNGTGPSINAPGLKLLWDA
jgi:hypothetical protein